MISFIFVFSKNQHNLWSKNIFLKPKTFSLNQKYFSCSKKILCSYCVDMMMIKKLIYLLKRASNEIGVFPQSQYSPHVMPGENFMKTRWELFLYGCCAVERCVYKWNFQSLVPSQARILAIRFRDKSWPGNIRFFWGPVR